MAEDNKLPVWFQTGQARLEIRVLYVTHSRDENTARVRLTFIDAETGVRMHARDETVWIGGESAGTPMIYGPTNLLITVAVLSAPPPGVKIPVGGEKPPEPDVSAGPKSG